MMLKMRVFPFVCLIVVSMFLWSCAASLASVWKNESFKGPAFKKVLVVGVAEIELNRIFFENTFKEVLAKKGVTSISSYTVLPSVAKIDRKVLEQKAKELGVDAVVVSTLDRLGMYEASLKDRKSGDLRYSELKSIYGDTMYDNVVPFWPQFFTTTDRVDVVMETSMYEAAEGLMVWAAHAKVTITERPYDEIESFVKKIVQRMTDDRVI